MFLDTFFLKREGRYIYIPPELLRVGGDTMVRCVKFVLPEELDVSGTPTGMCGTRSFRARFFANYIDGGFECCGAIL